MTLRHGDRPGDADEGVGISRHSYEVSLFCTRSQIDHFRSSSSTDPIQFPVHHLRPSTFGPVTLAQFLREEIERTRIDTISDKGKGKQKDVTHKSPVTLRTQSTRIRPTKTLSHEHGSLKDHNVCGDVLATNSTDVSRTTRSGRFLNSRPHQPSAAKTTVDSPRNRATSIETSENSNTLSASNILQDIEQQPDGQLNEGRFAAFDKHARSKRQLTREHTRSMLPESINTDATSSAAYDYSPRRKSSGSVSALNVQESKTSNLQKGSPELIDMMDSESIDDTDQHEMSHPIYTGNLTTRHNLSGSLDFDPEEKHSLSDYPSAMELEEDEGDVPRDHTLSVSPNLQQDGFPKLPGNSSAVDYLDHDSDSVSTVSYENAPKVVGSSSSIPYIFDYHRIVPEISPLASCRKTLKSRVDEKSRTITNARTAPISKWFLRGNANTQPTTGRNSSTAKPLPSHSERERLSRLSEVCHNRKWQARLPSESSMAPPFCPTDETLPFRNLEQNYQLLHTDESCLPGFNNDIWLLVSQYLSVEDIRRLRLVSKGFASALGHVMMRNVVTKFGKSFFDLYTCDHDARNQCSRGHSMLTRFSKTIKKFGIFSDYDFDGLANVQPKVVNRQEQAWFGNFTWPVEKYPRYPNLQMLEDLVDNNRALLKDELAHLNGVTELGLSIDSGHGWLEGPDISDLALYEARRNKGSRVFGRSFHADDIWQEFGRDEYFKWAQQNSINESIKELSRRMDSVRNKQKVQEFEAITIRDYNSFELEEEQYDYDPLSHVGGQALPAHGFHPPQFPAQIQPHPPPQPTLFPALFHHTNGHIGQFQPQSATTPAVATRDMMIRRRRLAALKRSSKKDPIQSQYPLIFNGHNISAATGGNMHWATQKSDDVMKFPVLPGLLTEEQVEWLMETVWAQRAFLSSYATAIIMNKRNLESVHTLNISSLSSGLLPCLEQSEFWSSLPRLKKLKILINPDWRNEHVAGDSFYATNMRISPLVAAMKFSQFLNRYVARLEGLSHLSIGYHGGGEHATGMYARNQHVLPAPITDIPRTWITDHLATKPDPSNLVKFDHIRELVFENCWFSPCMLQAFMIKSRDSSLHTLTLNSVSMLAKNDSNTDGPLMTTRNNLKCKHSPENYLLETIPNSAAWVDVLDKITTGPTLLDQKYNSGLFDSNLSPKPTRQFRGNVKKIILNSCGYVKISGVKGDQLNQNALVVHSASPMDLGLVARKARFERGYSEGPLTVDEDDSTPGSPIAPSDITTGGQNTPVPDNTSVADTARMDVLQRMTAAMTAIPKSVMMSTIDPVTNTDWFGLGTLTQCVHPIEKRILECAWGMRFGWGDTMERWKSVEDGFFEGGTGRFSGFLGVEDEN